MYEVTIRNGNLEQTIHESSTLFTNRKLDGCKIEEGKNAISSLDFTIYPNNDGYDSLNVYKTKIFVYNKNKHRYDFSGRIIQIVPCMDNDGTVYKTVVCESGLGYLCDTIQPYAETMQYEGDNTRNGLQEFVDVLLDNHNSQVEEDRRIYRGSVIADESFESVNAGLNYETTWDCLKTKILDVYGGEIQIRETDGILYLDYAKELGATRSTTIELGKNMQSAQRKIDCTNIVTRLIPLGAKLDKSYVENGEYVEKIVEERLTIASVNDGKIYIENEAAYSLYGAVYKTVVFDDINNASDLKKKGTEYLAEHSALMENNTIKALDLSMIGLDIDDFRVYDRYPVRNSLIGLDATLEIVKKTTDIIEPYSSSFEMGERTAGMSDSIVDIMGDNENGYKKYREEIIYDFTRQTNSILTVVEKNIETQLLQSEESIAASVGEKTVSKSEYETFGETVKNILQMDANGTSMIFQTINEAIQEVGNTSESHYAEILKYIRFEDGNIILGEYSNPLMLKIEHDRIAFYQNGVAVAYFNDNKLFVTHGEFTDTFMLGKFQAAPRANGNVTWKVVG